jgi:hypothetical protein
MGSSETYAIKYLLSKFFLMPVKDEGDPDYRKPEEMPSVVNDQKKTTSTTEKTDQSLTEIQNIIGDQLAQSTNPTATISMQQVEELTNLLRQKNQVDKDNQAKFFAELDKKLTQQGVVGTTQTGNYKMRFSLLTRINYQYLYNWLLNLSKQ